MTTTNGPPGALAAAIGRGEVIFNTKTFPIDNVAGINRDPGDPVGAGVVFNGFCGTCHDSPNIGNHSTSLPIDIGVTAVDPVGGLDVALLPTYTFQETSTGRTITVTDPGRALISGKFRDIGKTKGPNLRALATRAPYFHNGSAPDFATVINFYDARFHIGFTAQEKSDLAAFLSAL
jgi:cytochrome c peroxidase